MHMHMHIHMHMHMHMHIHMRMHIHMHMHMHMLMHMRARKCLIPRISFFWAYDNCQKVQYAWGYLPVPGRHVMMYLYLIGRVAGNGDNKVMELESPPLNGV